MSQAWYDPFRHRRRSIRLPEHDYAGAGGYFLTICTQGHRNLLSTVEEEGIILSPAGWMVEAVWRRVQARYVHAMLGPLVIMPNHIHTVISMGSCASEPDARGIERPDSLGSVVRWFKTVSTNEYFRGVRRHGWPRVDRRLWQRSYYEHIIRNAEDWEDVRKYIAKNPSRWRGRHRGS